MTDKEKQDYERIFLVDIILLKDFWLKCVNCWIGQEKEDSDGFTLFYYKTTNGRTSL